MTFQSAKCPNCGGTLQLPKERRTAICIYCGQTIVVVDAIKLAGGANVGNLMELAAHAIKTYNFKTAHSYYTKILEHDINHIGAWIGKGVTDSLKNNDDAWRGCIGGGAVRCFERALELAGERQQVQKQIVSAIQTVFVVPRLSHLGIMNDYVSQYVSSLDAENAGARISTILSPERLFDDYYGGGTQEDWPKQRLENYRNALALAKNDPVLIEVMTERILTHLSQWGRRETRILSDYTEYPRAFAHELESPEYNYKNIVAFAETVCPSEAVREIRAAVQRRFDCVRIHETHEKIEKLESERSEVYKTKTKPWVVASGLVGGFLFFVLAVTQCSSRETNWESNHNLARYHALQELKNQHKIAQIRLQPTFAAAQAGTSYATAYDRFGNLCSEDYLKSVGFDESSFPPLQNGVALWFGTFFLGALGIPTVVSVGMTRRRKRAIEKLSLEIAGLRATMRR